MRILMITNTPWTRDLGAARVQLELGEELAALGHFVEKFSFEDAYPPRPGRGPSGVLRRTRDFWRTTLGFSRRAREHVRAHAERFDVIDASHPDLPFSKRDLGFSGLLVARSVALVPAYDEFNRFAAARWPRPASLRGLAHAALAWPGHRRRSADVLPCFRAADLINVSNTDDLARVRDTLGFGAKAVHFPFGLSDARRAAFRRAAEGRRAGQTAAFIGAWNDRKGAHDWPAIAGRVLARLPEARFLFLGTGYDRAYVLRGFPEAAHGAIEVVPRYAGEDLPALLSRAQAGAFPGYLEGFGFSVLEKLAAGLPVVTYDAPGPRDMMRHHALCPMTPPGDTAAFAGQLIRLLTSSAEDHARASRESLRVASLFSWREIAAATAALYAERKPC